MGREQIKKGDNLLVIGQVGKGNLIDANMIKIMCESDNIRSGSALMGQKDQTGQMGQKPRRGESQESGPGHMAPENCDNEGPVIGSVMDLEPLTINASNGAMSVNYTDSTKIFKHVQAVSSEIVKGTKVRIFAATSRQGEENKQKEAQKIIAISGSKTEMGNIMEKPYSKPIAIPKREANAVDFLEAPFGFLTAPPQPGYLFDLDVNWMVTGIRLASWEDIEKQKGVYDFSAVDESLEYLFKNGVNTIIELRAINPVYGTPSGKGAVRGVSFPEQYMAEWGKFVEKLVERYDGDGIDDADGITVKNYQLIHELLLPGIKKDFWRENPDKYVKFFKITYYAIKKSCQDCNLYFIGGFDEDFLFKGEKNLRGEILGKDGFFADVMMEFQNQGIRPEHLGFDYHYWSHWLLLPNAGPETYRNHVFFINNIKKLYRSFGYKGTEVSIISKEAGVNGFIDTEREQSIYLLKIYVTSIASGQKHLFWTSIVEYLQEANLFLSMGLVNNPRVNDWYSHKKLAYYAYKLMVEKLKNSTWKEVKTITEDANNISVYKFPQKNGKSPIYVVWWDYFNEKGIENKEITLRLDFNSDEVTITASVPTGKNGKELKDTVPFDSEYKKTNKGSVSILLGESPVYIEEGVIPKTAYQVKKINPEVLDNLLN